MNRRSCLLSGFLLTLGASPAFAQCTLQVEPNHSTVAFSVPIAGGITRVTGKFTAFKLEINFDEKNLTRSSVSASIQADSIQTGIEARDADLRGEQFFAVKDYPEITFESREIKKRGRQYVAIGPLNMRGMTKTVELPFVITAVQWDEKKRPVLGISVRYELNRLDFGVGAGWRHTSIPNFIGNSVTIEIHFWTRPGKAKANSGAL